MHCRLSLTCCVMHCVSFATDASLTVDDDYDLFADSTVKCRKNSASDVPTTALEHELNANKTVFILSVVITNRLNLPYLLF